MNLSSKIPIYDLSPFGMLIAERSETFATNGYRFGFNGQEGDDEVNGEGNSLNFGARIFDSRIGRWMSLDPLSAMYPSHSNFTFAANSPLIFVDFGGEVLVLGGQVAKSTKDVRSLIENPDYRDVITTTVVTLEDGSKIAHVNFNIENVEGLTQDIVDNDPGLKLIQNLVNSSEDYLYEAAKKTLVYNSIAQDYEEVSTAKFPDNVFSKTPKFYEQSDSRRDPTPKPMPGGDPGKTYDGQTAIHPYLIPQISVNNQRVDISRAGLVFHALAEMYLRTEPLGDAQKPGYPNEYGMPYSLRDPSGYNGTSNGGAHEGAIELQGAKY